MSHVNRFVRVVFGWSLAAAALADPLVLGAQAPVGSVTGRVTDDAGAPAQGASVLLMGTQYGAKVRSDGSYRLTAPAGRYAITARLIGYSSRTDSVTITAGQTATINFMLGKAATTLEAVTTLGTRGEQRTVLDAPVPIDVLPSMEIARRAAPKRRR